MKYPQGQNQNLCKNTHKNNFSYNFPNKSHVKALFNKAFSKSTQWLLILPLIISSQLLAEVTPSGAFVTTIPIELPPGSSPIAPNLSLKYSSNGGDGLVGIG